MQYIVLKDLPDGSRPGDKVEFPEELGQVFLLAEAIRPATEAEQRSRKRTGYSRRDMQAEPPSDE